MKLSFSLWQKEIHTKWHSRIHFERRTEAERQSFILTNRGKIGSSPFSFQKQHVFQYLLQYQDSMYVALDYGKNHTWISTDGKIGKSFFATSYVAALDYVKTNHPGHSIKIEQSVPRRELIKAIERGIELILVNQYDTAKYREEHDIEKSDANDAAIIYRLEGKHVQSIAELPLGNVKTYHPNEINIGLQNFIHSRINNGDSKKLLQVGEDAIEHELRPEEFLRKTNYYDYLPPWEEVPDRFKRYLSDSWPAKKKFNPEKHYRDLIWKTAAYIYPDMSRKDFVREYGFYGRKIGNNRVKPRPQYLRSMYFWWSGFKMRTRIHPKTGKETGRGSSVKDMKALGKYIYEIVHPYVLQTGERYRIQDVEATKHPRTEANRYSPRLDISRGVEATSNPRNKVASTNSLPTRKRSKN